MGLFLFQEAAEWGEAASCSSVTCAVASLALSLGSLGFSCLWGKSRIQWKEQGEIWHKMETLSPFSGPQTEREDACFIWSYCFSTFLESLIYLQSVCFDVMLIGILTCDFLFASFTFGHSLLLQFGVKQELNWVWFIEMEFHIMFHGIYMVLIPSGEKTQYLQCLKIAALSVWNLLLI